MGSNPTVFFGAEAAKIYDLNGAEVTLSMVIRCFRVFHVKHWRWSYGVAGRRLGN